MAGARLARTAGRLLLLLLILGLAATGPGCVGPPSLKLTRLRYDEAIHETGEQLWLRNLVRLRYGEMPTYLDVSAITSQFEVSGSSALTAGRERASTNQSLFGQLGMQFRDAPTLSYTPQHETDLTRAILAPVSITSLGQMANSGWGGGSVLRLIIAEANGLMNAPGADQLIPATIPLDCDFEQAAILMAQIRTSGVGYLASIDDPQTVSAPIPAAQVKGTDLVAAADKKMTFKEATTPDGKSLVLTRDNRAFGFIIRADRAHDPDVELFRKLLQLNPRETEYRVRRVERSTVNPFDPIKDSHDTISVRTRTILEMMIFLSKGVRIPEEHLERRLAAQTPGPDGIPFDWTQVTRGMFRVCVQKKKPKNAAVAIEYRGYWYFLDEADHVSRATLTLIHALLNVELNEPRREGPVLTLPVGL